MVALSPVPEISISLASPEEPVPEPFSPFSTSGFGSPCTPATPEDNDGFRSTLLSPPPTSPRFPRQLSPLRPVDVPVCGKGIERERFEQLLRASRERNASVGGKKSPDLRKEIALKVHRNKQVERRALFLSKVQAPPSPRSTLLPKTPPESPALFHYSLPSPGLRSPLTAFADEELAKPRESWVEQVDFRLPEQDCVKPPPRSASLFRTQKLPSLEQITAHLSNQAVSHDDVGPRSRRTARLPAFLQLVATAKPEAVESARPRPALPPGVGRLHFPLRSASPPEELAKPEVKCPSPRLPPSPCTPKLQIKTTVVPRTSSHSPIDLTEDNLRALDLARERTAQNMFIRLRRRTMTPEGLNGDGGLDERKLRRHSAPPELPSCERIGFMNPRLNLPGAF
ncbi:uncharacterized protein PHACADRAFT_247154 [Phanerochaete carnosa HHB-10118-sp]|uniref:Uncharacterized protein n=1 Tax=Phanerochaete carnosa (strain HHB-10118-sp) TaxID=650164 RepID=K5XD43_PHACS|nr:uncharacterized protein PHACADRAFT_247154 [Phanerochaete carnosa HHB-10118-sp]EKM60927.1 hypothetical protein PHACADRAFT_247154 [Phanerochaete carnosa HHB-10118-sp]